MRTQIKKNYLWFAATFCMACSFFLPSAAFGALAMQVKKKPKPSVKTLSFKKSNFKFVYPIGSSNTKKLVVAKYKSGGLYIGKYKAGTSNLKTPPLSTSIQYKSGGLYIGKYKAGTSNLKTSTGNIPLSSGYIVFKILPPKKIHCPVQQWLKKQWYPASWLPPLWINQGSKPLPLRALSHKP